MMAYQSATPLDSSISLFGLGLLVKFPLPDLISTEGCIVVAGIIPTVLVLSSLLPNSVAELCGVN